MASKVKLEAVNREQVMKQLALVAPNAEVLLAGMQMKIARDLADKIKARAPDGFGNYKRSIEGARLADRPGRKLVGGNIQDTKDKNATGIFGSPLWHLLEFGTKARYTKSGKYTGIGPRMPHIFPTYRAERKNYKRRMARVMRTAIKNAMENQRATQDEAV